MYGMHLLLNHCKQTPKYHHVHGSIFYRQTVDIAGLKISSEISEIDLGRQERSIFLRCGMPSKPHMGDIAIAPRLSGVRNIRFAWLCEIVIGSALLLTLFTAFCLAEVGSLRQRRRTRPSRLE